MDRYGCALSAVKTNQFVNVGGIDWDLELGNVVPWQQRYA